MSVLHNSVQFITENMEDRINEKIDDIIEKIDKNFDNCIEIIGNLQKDNERLAQRCRKLEEDNFILYNKIRNLTIAFIIEGIILTIIGIALIII